MSAAELRDKLHSYINTADERHLQAIYVLVERDISTGYVYDEATVKELEQRRTEYLSGTGTSYTAEESIELIRN